MTAPLDPIVARAAQRGSRVGVLVLVERPAQRGPMPLALDANLRTLSERTQDVCHEARTLLRDPGARTGAPAAAGALIPLGLDAAAAPRGGVVLENLGAVMAAVDPADLDKVRDVPGVRKVIAMPRFVPLIVPLRYRAAAPADLIEGPARSLHRVGVPAMWDQDLRGQGITIGHFDTGINAAHPAFAGLRAARRLRYAAFGADGRRVPRARARDTDVGTIVHHGTHTAGTLVGESVDGLQVGIAPGARLVSVQIFPQPGPGSQGDQDQLVVNALNWIVGERPQVLNLSFGDTRYNDSYLGIIGELIDQNIAIVAAVGNQGIDTSSSPGNYASVIGVGAIDGRNRICAFSGSATVRRAPRPDLCAPGLDVLSAGRGDEFALSTGTSMAAPHVAGVLALLRQRAPDLTPAQLKALLRRTARRPAGWEASRGGAGILDGRALLSAV
ncbi:MAG: S8 family peptidase [Rhodocyclales bacterium]|nr:S8 family peptidase [Rhodocyclales bacterium]